MKKLIFIFISALIFFSSSIFGQDDVTVIVPTTEAGENLDLQAVMELFRDAETVEDFEKVLNDSTNEVNNLDLNEDGTVDYIRVVEQVDGDVHILILQVPLGENEYQDVATINIEKNKDEYILQAQGDPDLYGEDYYVEPEPEVEVQTITVVVVMYGVGYSPWISPWHWRVYPVWWRPWRPHPISVYRSRVVRHHRSHYRHSRHRSTVRSHNTYKSHRKTSKYSKQNKKKNTYTTQPTKQTKKKEQTKKENQKKKKQPTKKKTGTKKKK